MLLADVFRVEILAHTPPYYLVRWGEDAFTIVEEALDYPYFPDEDPEEQWLNWLIEFSVSIDGITSVLLQKSLHNAETASLQ